MGCVLGCDVYSFCVLELIYFDLFWYGIYGVELLFIVMGLGCEWVMCNYCEEVDIVVGIWFDGWLGMFCGFWMGKIGYGGMVFGFEGIVSLG